MEYLSDELKIYIFSYLPITTLKVTKKEFFIEYLCSKCFWKDKNINTYMRNVVKYDCIFILKNIFLSIPPSIIKKRITYRKKNMNYFEYLNHLSIYYCSTKCRNFILTTIDY